MANIIIEISETEYTVNNKRCYLDINSNWIAAPEMTTSEVSAMQRHLLKENNLLVKQQ